MDNLINIHTERRHQKLVKFGETISNKIRGRTYGDPSLGPETVLVDQGYNVWKSVVEASYPQKPDKCTNWLMFKQSSIWH